MEVTCLNLVSVKTWKSNKLKQNNNDKRRIPACLLTLIVKEVKISVEQGRVEQHDM